MRHRGAAVLLMLLVVITTVAAGLLAHAAARATARATPDALAEAKAALLAWPFGRLPNTAGRNDGRPGSLPCPDLHAPGSENEGWQGNDASPECNTLASRLGRLPWRTLGIAKPEDGVREGLWYLVASPFHDSDNSPLNSDTPGLFQPFADQGKTALTSAENRAVAIVFAPGAALAGQLRDSASKQLKASNYLESVKIGSITYNNAATATTAKRLTGPATSTFNDRFVIITQRELMAPAEVRAVREYQQLLRAYQARMGRYPDPARFEETGCTESGSAKSGGCIPEAGLCAGRPPKSSWFAGINGLGLMAGERSWLYLNHWEQVLYYSAGCGPATLLSTGPAQSGQVRNTAGARGDLANYLDDAFNRSSDGSLSAPSGASNDRLYRLP